VPGINEVWSLVSGTRSNPPHGDAYGGDYAQDGYQADPNAGRAGFPAGAPYAAAEGSSEAAEYYYEDQFNQQQQYQYSEYDQYSASSAGQYEQAPYQAQQGYTPGYEPGYGEAPYQDGYGGQGRQDQGSPSQGYEPEYPTYRPSHSAGGASHAEAAPHSGYAAESDGYSADQGGYGDQGQGQVYPNEGYAVSYTEETSYAEGYAEQGQGYESFESYEGGYAETAYYEPSFGAAGTATALATEVLAPPSATETLLADPEATSTNLLPPVPAQDPETEAQARPATVPAPRRGRGAQKNRPATKADGAGKPPAVLRTRPRTGPVGRIVQGTVLAALVAGAVTYVAFDKSVTLNIDGQTQTMHTFAGTVSAVLSSDNVSTGSKDIVSPAPGSSTSNDETITVHYGRPLSLSVNGVTKTAWVHYPTVAAALQELGVRTAGAKISQPSSAVIPRAGLSGLVVYTLRHVTFLVDGKTVPVETTAATVTQAMAQAGIVLHNQDSPSVAASSIPTDNETITINRITGTTETKQVSIPYKTTQVSDPNTYTGTNATTTQGEDGVETITYAVQVINGVKQSPKQVSESVTKQPVDEVVSVGTKALPSSASDLNWTGLATCESGDNPSEDTGNGFYGMYQFTVGTWDAMGGSGLPSDASAATQTALAEKLYSESGAGSWPVCGKNLFS
jgi:uncharacterized protein YabE (DUF348 family)